MNATQLNDKRRSCKDAHSDPSRVRAHRAISWLARAEQETDDDCARFIFLWISFNAAYAREIGDAGSEREKLIGFLRSLLQFDQQKCIHQVLFNKFSGPIRTLVENKYVFEPFWRALREHDSSGQWEDQFISSKRASLHAIVSGNTLKVLGIVFDRLYVLRNQVVHGGSTWNGGINRAQVRDGASILMSLVPVIIDLMLDHPELELGPINYPVI